MIEIAHHTDVAEIEGLTALHVIEGYVWCSKHGEVHSDSLNPYGYAESVPDNDFCTPEDHDAIFADTERHVKAWRGEPVPSGLRAVAADIAELAAQGPTHIPVELKVRRQTPDVRRQMKENMMLALASVAVTDEERERIADELLAVAAKQGTLLRRARLSRTLREMAEEFEEMGPAATTRKATREKLVRWSDVLMEAAEEIEGFQDEQ
jgi:hypothetical protein